MNALWRLTAAVLLLGVCSGAGCPRVLHQYFPNSAPPVFPTQPTLADLSAAVNGNRDLVQSLYAAESTISVPLAPALRCELSMERPRRFRLRGSTSLTGPEVDLGSNDERFWLWVRMAQPSATYTCRHDQFQTSAARQILPVEPEWLIDACGLAGFDPALAHGEPMPVRGGRFYEVRTSLPTPQGNYTKVTLVEAARGFVAEQHVYDSAGQRLASALTSQPWRDPLTGAILPKRIEIQWPATHFNVTIHVQNWMVNSLPGEAAQLWAMPEFPGYPLVDLADPRWFPVGGQASEPVGLTPQAVRPSTPVTNGVRFWR